MSVANPLTLVMTINSAADYTQLYALLTKIQSQPDNANPIVVALNKLQTVHFARFVFLSQQQLAVITTYDGSFDDYLQSFIDAIGDVFNALLAHMKDHPRLPVQENRKEFLDYVRNNDIQCVGNFYSAYPKLSVVDILTLQQG